jgi:phage protein D/phage baseplate assembly protein gpV
MSLNFMQVSINFVPLMEPMPLANALKRCIVDSNQYMPSMFELHFLDNPFAGIYEIMDSEMLSIGMPVTISAKPAQTDNFPPTEPIPIPLINGEITALEAHFDQKMSIVARGYDKMHRLNRGRHTRTFMAMNDAAIVEMIALEAGLEAAAMPSPRVNDYLLQNNMSDLEFLQMIANRVGFDLAVDELGVLMFKEAGVPEPVPGILEWGGILHNLISFHPRATAARQVNEVTAQAYSPLIKESVVGVFPVPPNEQGGPGLIAQAELARTVFTPTAGQVVSDKPMPEITGEEEAEMIAEGEGMRIARDFVQAEGLCVGNPEVMAGRLAEVQGVGLTFSGTYLLTSATHTEDASGYRTSFRVDGSEARTLTTLLTNNSQTAPGRIPGIVNGLVMDNVDPEGLGRVKCILPFLGVTEEGPVISNWCRLASPMAGMQRGFFCVPNIGDEVLLAFEQGDINFPYVIGAVWNTEDRPPIPGQEAVIGGDVVKHVFKSGIAGHTLTFDDTPGMMQIELKTPMQHTIVLGGEPPGITITDPAQNTIQINEQGITIRSMTTMTINAAASLTIESEGAVSINCATFSLTAEGTAVIEATGGIDMSSGAGSVVVMSGGVSINEGALMVLP